MKRALLLLLCLAACGEDSTSGVTPTPDPTGSPSQTPTQSPSQTPTGSPSQTPTGPPSQTPTQPATQTPAPTPPASTFVVSIREDLTAPSDGAYSLRAAILAASASGGRDEITFDAEVFTDGGASLTFDSPLPPLDGDRLRGTPAAVTLTTGLELRGGASIDGLTFAAPPAAAATIRGGGEFTVRNITVNGGAGGVVVEEPTATTSVTVRGSTFDTMAAPGILLREPADLLVDQCVIQGNAAHGVEVTTAAAHEQNCEGGLVSGVGAGGERQVTVRGSEFQRNGGFGVWVHTRGIDLRVEDCTFSGHGQDGIRVENQSRLQLRGGSISANAGNGVGAFNGLAALFEVSISGNGGSALNQGQNFCNVPIPSAPSVSADLAAGIVTGTAAPGAEVSIYGDPAEELGTYLGTATAGADGSFRLETGDAITGPRVNAISLTYPNPEVPISGPPGLGP